MECNICGIKFISSDKIPIESDYVVFNQQNKFKCDYCGTSYSATKKSTLLGNSILTLILILSSIFLSQFSDYITSNLVTNAFPPSLKGTQWITYLTLSFVVVYIQKQIKPFFLSYEIIESFEMTKE